MRKLAECHVDPPQFTRVFRVLVLGRVRSTASIVAGAALVLLSVAAGWTLGQTPAGATYVYRVRFLFTLGIAAVAVIASIDQISDDERLGWIRPLVVAGLPRWLYAAALGAVLLLEHLLLFLLVMVGLGVALAITNVNVTPLPWRQLAGGAAFIVSTTVYGLLIALLFRRRTVALLSAAGIFLIPWIFITYWNRTHSVLLPELYLDVLLVWSPKPSISTSSLFRHTMYAFVVGVLVLVAAERRAARVE